MSEKFLNFIIKLFLVVDVSGFFIINGNYIPSDVAMGYFKHVYLFVFIITPLLLMIKVVSRLFLSGFKGKSVSFIENMFVFCYFLLTKEAREEWSSYIKKKKQESALLN